MKLVKVRVLTYGVKPKHTITVSVPSGADREAVAAEVFKQFDKDTVVDMNILAEIDIPDGNVDTPVV